MNAIIQRIIRTKNWLKERPVAQFFSIAILGFAIAFFAPPRFLAGMFGVVVLAVLIFAALSRFSAEKKPAPMVVEALASLLSLPANPSANVKDRMALRCFFLSITVLVAMAVGLFAAVPFQ